MGIILAVFSHQYTFVV